MPATLRLPSAVAAPCRGPRRQFHHGQFRVLDPAGKLLRRADAAVVQLPRPGRQLVFKVGRRHGNVALHLGQPLGRVFGQVQRAIEQQVLVRW